MPRRAGESPCLRRCAIISAVAAVAATWTAPLHAANFFWRGTNSGFAGADGTTFTLPANWSTNAAPGAADLAGFDSSAPAHQWQLGTSVWLGRRTEINGTLFHVGALSTLAVPAYTRADARVEITLTRRLSAIAAGRNLLDPLHTEFTPFTIVATQVPRSADIQLVWKF